MMRLPRFAYRAPETVHEAVTILAGEGPSARVLAGGTDLLPNMKRRQQTPATLVSLRRIPALHRTSHAQGVALGACTTLADLVQDRGIRDGHPALWQAAAQVATPHLRNTATLGGNLCLDTRCWYYDQNWEWRRAIDFCMKKDGSTCWVAPGSPRCLAVSSTDTAPALVALGAHVRLESADGTRVVPVAELFRNDGIEYLAKRADEILTEVLLEPADGWRSAYWKLRRRGSFDFPVLGVAAAARFASDGRTVEQARVVLGAVSSMPQTSVDAAELIVGHELTDARIERAAQAAGKVAKPMDNTDFTLHWRKRVAGEMVSWALRELRGDDVRAARVRYARHDPGAAIEG